MKTFFIFLFFSNFVFAQNTDWTISGKVSDENHQPLEFVNVFANNTSIGTTTNAKGFFQLTIPAKIPKIDLVISFVGFKTIKKTIAATDKKLTLVFSLESNNLLKEVKITAKSDKNWKRKWRKFEKAFMGDTWFAKDCKILNPEVIQLEDGENGKVMATATLPIIVQNNALGFKIIYEMEKFETDGLLTVFSGNERFEGFQATDEKQILVYKKNRAEAYENSFTNFLSSLAKNTLEKNGFEVYKMMRIKEIYYKATLKNDLNDGSIVPCNAHQICKYDTETKQYVLYSPNPLLVFLKNKFNAVLPIYSDYPFQYSSISLPRNYIVFAENGWLSMPNGMILHEYWAKEGFANLLPQNYNADENDDYQTQKTDLKNTKDSLQMPVNSLATKGFKEENMTKEIELKEVVLDQNDLLKKPEKPIELFTADYTVKIQEADYSYTIFDLLRKIPGIRIKIDPANNEYEVSFNENHSQSLIQMSKDSKANDATPALVLNGTMFVGKDNVISMLNSIAVREIKYIGATRFGNNAAAGSRGGNGTIIINLKP